MITSEYLAEKKAYYESKCNYLKNIEFDTLAADFQGIVALISEMENYINTENKKNKF